MIQRIQTVYLALASLCTFGLLATDTAETDAPVAASELFADAHYTVTDDYVLLSAVVVAGIVALVAIFLFRTRKLQLRFSQASIFLVIVSLVYGIMLWYNDNAAAQAEPEPGLALPILALVFAFLAGLNIRKDEKLVRSADRLR